MPRIPLEWLQFAFECLIFVTNGSNLHSNASNLHSNALNPFQIVRYWLSNLIRMARICIRMLRIPFEWFEFAFEFFLSGSKGSNLHLNASKFVRLVAV